MPSPHRARYERVPALLGGAHVALTSNVRVRAVPGFLRVAVYCVVGGSFIVVAYAALGGVVALAGIGAALVVLALALLAFAYDFGRPVMPNTETLCPVPTCRKVMRFSAMRCGACGHAVDLRESFAVEAVDFAADLKA